MIIIIIIMIVIIMKIQKKETNNWLLLEMIPLGKGGETIKYSSRKMKLNI